MIFAPLGGTDQSFLFRVPASDHNRPLGLPARLQQFAQPVHRLQHRRRAAVRIDRSIHPGIAMIARHHPLVGRRRSPNFANDIPNGAELVVLLKVHLHFRGTGTDVVSKRQRALPLARRERPAEVFENRRSIGVRKRSHGNLRQLLGLGGRHALRIGQSRSGRHARCGRVSGKLEHESDRSALHAARRAPRPFRIGVAAVVAIVFRVGINDDSGRAAFLRHERFHAAKILAVTDDDDLAAHIDVHLLQLVKVSGRAVVRIDNFRLGVARGRHAVVRRHDARIVLKWIAVDMLAPRPMHLHSGAARSCRHGSPRDS